jgi:hypothetical protein
MSATGRKEIQTPWKGIDRALLTRDAHVMRVVVLRVVGLPGCEMASPFAGSQLDASNSDSDSDGDSSNGGARPTPTVG